MVSNDSDRRLLQDIYHLLQRYSSDTVGLRDEIGSLRDENARLREDNVRTREQIDEMRRLDEELRSHLKEAPSFKTNTEHRLNAVEAKAESNRARIAERDKEETLSIKSRNKELEDLYKGLEKANKGLEKADKTNKVMVAIAVIEFLGIVAVAVFK